jgi:hypothetical protein
MRVLVAARAPVVVAYVALGSAADFDIRGVGEGDDVVVGGHVAGAKLLWKEELVKSGIRDVGEMSGQLCRWKEKGKNRRTGTYP